MSLAENTGTLAELAAAAQQSSVDLAYAALREALDAMSVNAAEASQLAQLEALPKGIRDSFRKVAETLECEAKAVQSLMRTAS